MTYFVICGSKRFFESECGVRFEGEKKTMHMPRYELVLHETGDKYRYLSSVDMLRGYHEVKVVFWGEPPKWYVDDKQSIDNEIRFAEMNAAQA